MKQFFGDNIEDFKAEAKMWKKIYEINTEIITLGDNHSLILPLIFTAETHYTKSNTKEIYFQLDLKKIFTQIGALPAELCKELTTIQNNLISCYSLQNVYKCAKIAIKEFAKKGYIHDDIDWRHIGLLPLFKNDDSDICSCSDDGKKIIGFKPILIDLELVTKEKDVKIAKKVMRDKLSEISKNCVFIEAPVIDWS